MTNSSNEANKFHESYYIVLHDIWKRGRGFVRAGGIIRINMVN